MKKNLKKHAALTMAAAMAVSCLALSLIHI